MNPKTISYWTTTILLAFSMGSGGGAELALVKNNVDGIVQLGYPVYFIVVIGIWKVMGTVALLVPRFPRLKEWAYAGIFFNMTGAAISNAVCANYGNFGWRIIVDLSLAGLAVASWALRPQSRTLGALVPGSQGKSL